MMTFCIVVLGMICGFFSMTLNFFACCPDDQKLKDSKLPTGEPQEILCGAGAFARAAMFFVLIANVFWFGLGVVLGGIVSFVTMIAMPEWLDGIKNRLKEEVRREIRAEMES